MHKWTFRILILVAAFACVAIGQNISSSVTAVLLDPSGAPVPGASCTLTNPATGVRLTGTSGADGSVTFPSVFAGTYTFQAQAGGFKSLELRDIMVTSSERRSLGNLSLQVGELRDSVSVTAEAAAVQTLSAEHSGVVTGAQLNDVALKGRDFFALLATIPGVVDTNASREATSNASNGGTFINGQRDNQKNFSVDGITDMDVGSNQSLAFMPNMDAIAEVKVLTSNYQAEYGRNSGGMVTVITKSGTRDLHGSAYYNYRNETLNANSFFNNRTGTPKSPYRYRINGFSVGGPVIVPKLIHRDKEKFFFFFSQEYTGVKRDYGSQFVNVATAAERAGDFSRSFDVSNALIVVRDPLTGQAFPGNRIPQNRLSTLGQNMLNFFPLPNYTDPDPRNANRWNYRSVYSGNTPRRNDIVRIDANLTPTFTMYYRYGHDKDIKDLPWGDWKTGSVNFLMSPVHVLNPGSGHLVRTTKTFSATLVNEAIFGYNRMQRDFDFLDPTVALRSRMGNPPKWYKNALPAGSADYIPNVIFGGNPASPANAALSATIPNHYENPNINVTDNITKVWRTHNFKAGFYYEHARIEHVANINARGQFDFSRDPNNPFDTNHSFANALLGNFRTYSETSAAPYGKFLMVNVEWYAQDNWRITKRLTLDYGMRFYSMPAMRNDAHNTATWDPTLYNPAKAPTLYAPGRNAAGVRSAVDPRTGVTYPAALIGLYVPGTGEFANGTAVGGQNGYPDSLVSRSSISFGPRLGLAYDLFGNGKTALRTGFGMFYDTGQTNPLRNAMGNPPIAYSPVLYYGSLDNYAGTSGAIGPSNLSILFGDAPLPSTMNFSFGIQHQALGTVFDASYVGALSRHWQITRNLNPIPMFGRFDAKNGDPTQPGRALPDNFFRPYPGYGDLNASLWSGNSNYNAFQFSANRRFKRGLQFGAAFTWSKTLGFASGDGDSVSPYFPTRHRNYGPLSFDRPFMLVVNYMYDLPKIGSRMGFRPARWVFDNWQVSGITSFISGSPFTPGLGTSDGADLTGSSEGARVTVVGGPKLDKSERTFYRNFNTDAFARTPAGNFGNAGVGVLHGPGANNWDIAVSKRFPLFSEGRYFQFRTEMFNAWNHTQFSGYFTGTRFDTTGRQTDPNFGAYSSARPPRTIQLSLRVNF
jgi:hypothetical protein